MSCGTDADAGGGAAGWGKPSDDVSYQFAVELIEKVGWDAGNKKSASICI